MQLNGIKLCELKEYKYSGFLFDTTWNKIHAEILFAKTSKHLGVFKWVWDYLSKDITLMMYSAIILPLFDYYYIVICNGNSSMVSRLQCLYNREGCTLLKLSRCITRLDYLGTSSGSQLWNTLHTDVLMYRCHGKVYSTHDHSVCMVTWPLTPYHKLGIISHSY